MMQIDLAWRLVLESGVSITLNLPTTLLSKAPCRVSVFCARCRDQHDLCNVSIEYGLGPNIAVSQPVRQVPTTLDLGCMIQYGDADVWSVGGAEAATRR